MSEFPKIDPQLMLTARKTIDNAYRDFSREYGDQIETIFDPLLSMLIWFETILLQSPWWLIFSGICLFVFWVTRSWKTLGIVSISLAAIGYLGMWENTMRTLCMISVCTLFSICIGIPVGILMARSDRMEKALNPLLDVMQTMPAFVYLIPVVMLLGIGRIPGLIAVVIYAVPPLIRLTNVGIRLVDQKVIEAADAFGASYRQRLIGVQLPLALPNIMTGINQTIMMALAMVVIASMIGVKGLGQPVLRSITNQYFTLGLLNGLAIVALAVIFDRISQAYGRRLQKRTLG